MGLRSYVNGLASALRGNPLENPAVSLASPAFWQYLNGGSPTASGELITDTLALKHIDVYACVRVLAESIGSLPLKLYERTESGRMEAVDQDLHYLLSVEPNPEMSAVVFWETMTGCLALTGNSYAEIRRNNGGQIAALYPLHPRLTHPWRLPNGQIVFKTSDGQQPGDSPRMIAAADCLHFLTFSLDGLVGLNPIEQARQAIGLAIASQKFGARFFGNGSRPGGVLSTETDLDEKALNAVRASWEATQGGENQGRTAVLYGDWTYTQIGISPEDSQFLQTQQHSRTQIAALFRVPPHMIGDTSRLSNNNHEQQTLSFVTDTLRPYLSRYEAEIARKLMPTTGRKANKFFVQFDVRERLRGDFATTMQGLALGKQWGWYNSNDILEQLGDNPIGPVGDIYITPVNYGNSKKLLDPEASLAPSPPAKEPEGDAATTAQERSVLSRYGSGYLRMFRDAVGRVSAREKRDLGAIQTCFEPLIEAIKTSAEDDARSFFGLSQSWNSQNERAVLDLLKSIEKRSADWSPERADENAAIEMRKCVRALVLGVYRDAGAAVALQGEA